MDSPPAGLTEAQKGEILLPFLDEMSKHANWCRKNTLVENANCTCPAEAAAHEAAHIRQLLSERRAPAQEGRAEVQEDIAHLLKFYNVTTVEEVARIQSQRIDRLIAKLPPMPDKQPRNYREG